MSKEAQLNIQAKIIGNIKKKYIPPQLVNYGAVHLHTQASVTGANENGGGMMAQSDRRTKENIICIGTHSLGIGLYLFDYKPKFRDAWGHGRQFGVMADEVEKVMPEAVSIHPNGYKMVDYTMLRISRNLH